MAAIVSIGEVLWDVFAHSESLGGAPFNFAFHASRLGHEVIFVSAVGDDPRGQAALAKAGELGLRTDFIQVIPGAATGTVTVRVDSAGQPDFTIHRPAAYDLLQVNPERLAALHPEWLYFGTLYPFGPNGLTELKKLTESLAGTKRFYDVNLRRDSYTPELVAELMALADVVKMNDQEAGELESLAKTFKWGAVAVTRGAKGCSIRIGADFAEPAGYPVKVADTVGAGDAFAAAFLHGLTQGWDARRTGDFANRVGALVASRPGGVPVWSIDEVL